VEDLVEVDRGRAVALRAPSSATLGRMGSVEDIFAAWASFLVGPSSRWSTGNLTHADGGQVLGLQESGGG
jgi:NAD(P)-dependent dehydrogenase (short-subunit alcohol dehydrogenase family)